MDSMILDPVIGIGSFGISSILHLVGHFISSISVKNAHIMDTLKAFSPRSEEEKKRDHEYRLKLLEDKELRIKSAYEDVNNARAMTDRFRGVTRRGLAWALIIIPVVWGLSSLFSSISGTPSMTFPVTETHSFLFGIIGWSTTTLESVHGVFMVPAFQELLFMVYGFYFGREIIR